MQSNELKYKVSMQVGFRMRARAYYLSMWWAPATPSVGAHHIILLNDVLEMKGIYYE